MTYSRRLATGIALVALLHSALADISLIVPGFDPQPLSATEVGVDSSGHTTWVIVPGVATGGEDVGFVGTATLVEGPNDAHIFDAFVDEESSSTVTLDITCTISNGIADCTGNQGYGPTPLPLGTQGAFDVQGAAAAAAPSPASPTSSPTGSSGSSLGSAGSVTPAPAASRSATAAASGVSSTPVNQNGAGATRAGVLSIAAIVGAAIAGVFML